MTTLKLRSWSAATDAAWVAASDVARMAHELGIRHRLVGGVAVTLLTHLHGVDHRVPQRETADADMGVPRQVLATTDLVGALMHLGYTQEQGDRFRRPGEPTRNPCELPPRPIRRPHRSYAGGD